MATLPERADVVIVGAGIAGVTAAYYLARNNVDVVLLDRSDPAAEASGGNAGMIGESGGDPATTMNLQRGSVAIYHELAQDTGEDFELTMDGRLRLAITEEEVLAFDALVARSVRDGVEGHMLHHREVQAFEPALSDRVLGAAWFPGDGKVHPAKTTRAMGRAAGACGAVLLDHVRVSRLCIACGHVTSVMTDRGEIQASEVILAAGAWTPSLAATAGVHVPVFPGKGHMLATEPLPLVTTRVLRAEMIGSRQLMSGEMLIGSEVEHAGYDKTVNPAKIDAYLGFMRNLVPALEGAQVSRSWGCLRPMSIDQLPIVGSVPDVGGLHLLTGHGRSGMGLAPASAKALVDVMLTGRADIDLAPYALSRFANV